MRREIQKHIQLGIIMTTINPEKQNKHILSSSGYVEGRSYLLDNVNAQALVDKYHGTGRAEFSRSGIWISKEFVIADKDIGVNINLKTGEQTITNRFIIHYSKTGAHIVPTLKG